MHKPIGMPGKPCVYKEFQGFIYIVINQKMEYYVNWK